MAIYGNTIEPQEDRAVVAPRIRAHAQRIQRRARQDISQSRNQRSLDAALQEFGIELRRSLEGLERNVAGEAVGHDDVDRAAGDVVALDEAVELARLARGAQ